MPRHTHPRPRRKHSRAHTRYHRDRYISKRWRLAKRIYGDDFMLNYHWDPRPAGDGQDLQMRNLAHALRAPVFMHPEVVRRLSRSDAPPAIWPFYLDRNRFARNPFNTCLCLVPTRPTARAGRPIARRPARARRCGRRASPRGG